MAQTTEKIRFVYGTEAKYSSSAYGRDVYFCTDSRRIYARGVAYGAVDEGPWYTLSPYLYQDGTLYYYYIKIATITTGKTTHFRTLEFEVHDDANYATSCRYWLTMNVYSSTIKNLSLICTTTVESGSAQSARMEASMDTSGAVWVRFPSVDWGQRVRVRSVMEYASDGTAVSASIPFHTSPSKQTAKPANLSDPVSYSGGIRYSSGAFSYQKAYIHAKADSAEECTYANRLATARTLWGQSFNGTANVSGNMSGVGTVTLSNGCNIHPDGARIIIQKDSTSAVIIDANTFRRINTATAMALGSSTYRWAGIYSTGGNFNAELVNTSENGLRLANDSKSVILRKDSSNFYLLIADSTATGSNWNNLRPFYFNLTTGKVNMQNGVAISSGLSVSGAASFNAAVTGATEYTTAKGDGSRFAKMVPGAFRLMAATTGWANELNAFTNDGSTRLACIAGAYGEGDNVEYLYYGGTDYNAPVMVIKGSYVGIGTKSPAYPLHVVGRIKQSGGECQFSVGEYTDPWQNTSCAIKASGNVGIGGQLKVTGTVTAPTFSGNASSATVASVLKHNGSSPPSEGKPSQTGMQLFGAYNNGYPYAYGNVLRIKGTGSGGSSELLLGWSGTNEGIAHIYYRNCRDNTTVWSEWRQIAFTTDIEHYTLPAATNTVLGGVKLFSATVQSVAANAVSATSGRTYGVQKNSSGQLVVNVPWVNTTYGLASNTANGLMSNGQKQNLDILVSNAVTGLTWSGGKLQIENIPGLGSTVTIPNATTGANGLMSASDKAKLDGIASGANKYTLPAASTSAIGGVKTNAAGKWWNGGVPTVGTDGVMEVGKHTDYHYTNTMTADYSVRVSCPNVVGVTITLPSQTGTLLVDIPATTSKNGSMSAADKQKLEALYQYIGGLERMQYHSLRIPYRMWYDASTSANTTVTSAMLAGTQWSTVSEFATWLKNFCLHGGSVTLERSDPDGSAPRVQSCIWRYIGSATSWRLIVEYQGSFSSSAGTHNAFDEGLFIQFDPDGGTVDVRRYT